MVPTFSQSQNKACLSNDSTYSFCLLLLTGPTWRFHTYHTIDIQLMFVAQICNYIVLGHQTPGVGS